MKPDGLDISVMVKKLEEMHDKSITHLEKAFKESLKVLRR